MSRAAGVQFDMLVFQEVPWPIMLDSVRYLEDCGLGTVWVGDHYAWPPRPETPLLEAWTTLAALASSTHRIRLGTLVTNVPLRHPALVAKQAATVDCISGGRLDLGLGGGGYFETEYAWLNISYLAPRESITRFAEAVEIIERLLREQRLSFDGTYYHLADAPLVPRPVQHPRPPLLVAANGPRALRIAAQHADIHVSLGSPEATMAEALAAVHERNDLLDHYCAAHGRDPATLERAYFAGWAAGERPFASADALQEFIARYSAVGIQRFIAFYATEAHPDQASVAAGHSASRTALDAFAAQAIAAFRAAPDPRPD